MSGALTKLTACALTSISVALLLKDLHIQGWESGAFFGGAILFVVIGIILGSVFKIGILPSFLVSAILTAFIFLFITITFSIIMVVVAIFVVLIIVLIEM